MRDYPDQTPQSIAAAKVHQRQERARIAQLSGRRILDGPPFVESCSRCGHAVIATTRGGMERGLAAHFVWHMQGRQ